MKIKSIHKFSAAVLIATAFLCSCQKENYLPGEMILVEGTAKSFSDSKPIPGLEISLIASDRGKKDNEVKARTMTHTDGRYNLMIEYMPGFTYYVVAKDIDGNKNGGQFSEQKIKLNVSGKTDIFEPTGLQTYFLWDTDFFLSPESAIE